MTKDIELKCPVCGKKAGRAIKGGRVCINCGHSGPMEEFIIKEE